MLAAGNVTFYRRLSPKFKRMRTPLTRQEDTHGAAGIVFSCPSGRAMRYMTNVVLLAGIAAAIL